MTDKILSELKDLKEKHNTCVYIISLISNNIKRLNAIKDVEGAEKEREEILERINNSLQNSLNRLHSDIALLTATSNVAIAEHY